MRAYAATVAGTRDLDALLAGLSPRLHPGTLTVATLPVGRLVPEAVLGEAVAVVSEPEGLTVVVAPEVAAAHGLVAEGRWRRIELRVRSDLAAVGLTAAVAGALAAEGIPANVLAGFHHDHVLVPEALAHDALAALEALSAAPRPG